MIKLLGTIFLVLWVIFMWVVVIYVISRAWGPYIRSKRQEKKSIKARIKEKTSYQDYNRLTSRMEIVQKSIAFDCDDGEERLFDVPDHVFDWVEQGDDGVLVYQGSLFVDFDARRPKHDVEKVLDRLTR